MKYYAPSLRKQQGARVTKELVKWPRANVFFTFLQQKNEQQCTAGRLGDTLAVGGTYVRTVLIAVRSRWCRDVLISAH